MSFVQGRRTVIVENSPVSFAIMGAGEPHRRVLIRSNDKNLDLVGLDNRTFLTERDLKISAHFGLLSGLFAHDLHTFIVRTAPDYATVSDEDVRSSHLSFAWRGLATERDLAEVAGIFSMVAADLIAALDDTTQGSAEWQVAPLVALCRRATDTFIRRNKLRRAVLLFTLSVYGIIFFAFIFGFPSFLQLAKETKAGRPEATAPQAAPASQK